MPTDTATTMRGWPQIFVLYTMLLHYQPSPVTRLHRAVAMRYARGPEAALAELDQVGEALAGYHLFHATRAELLRTVGQPDAAREADQRALALTANPAEAEILRERLRWH